MANTQIDLQQFEDALVNARKRGTPGAVDLEVLQAMPAAPSAPRSPGKPPTIDLQNFEDALFEARKRGRPGTVDLESIGQQSPRTPTVPRRGMMEPPSPRLSKQYTPLAGRIADEVGVPRDLFFGLIEQESNWNPQAVSKAGARGLGQLMPGTAAGLGVKDSFDPEQNLRGAARYLKTQLNAFGGDVTKALAAYNAGPGAVRKYGGVPPYRETRDYVQRVQQRGKRYVGLQLSPETVQQPVSVVERSAAVKPTAVTPAASTAPPMHPTEKAFLAAQERWKKTPGRAPQAYEDRNVALAEQTQAFAVAEKAMRKQMEALAGLDEKILAGTATPQEKKRFEKSGKEYEAKVPLHLAWAKRLESYGQLPRQSNLFDPLHYGIEGASRPGMLGEIFGSRLQTKRTPGTLKEFGSRLYGKLPSMLQRLIPGVDTAEEQEQIDIERNRLQRAGVYRRLPQPSGNPAEQQQQIAAKNRMLTLMTPILGAIEGLSGRPAEQIYKRNPAAIRARMEYELGRPLTPWEKTLFHPLVRNYLVEEDFLRRVADAGTIEAVSEAAEDTLMAFGGGLALKLLPKGFLKSIVRPSESLLSREGLEYLVKKGAVELGARGTGGGFTGTVTGGTVSGYKGYQKGERGAKLRQTIAEGAREGALSGVAIASGFGVAGMGTRGAQRAGQRFDPQLRQWVANPAQQVGTLARGLKAKVTGKPPATKAVSAGPQVQMPDGQTLPLREMDFQTAQAVAATARSTGDTTTATRADEWATRHEAWEDARAWGLPKENIPDYRGAWNSKSDPLRRHHDVLDKASKDEKLPSGIRRALADAAVDANQTFIDGFRGALDDPFPNVGPPNVSVWRRLTPEQRRSLSPEAQKSLLALDAINSQRVLDPSQPWPATLKGKSAVQWETQADTLYQRAQSALERDFGPLPETMTPEAAIPEAQLEIQSGQPLATPGMSPVDLSQAPSMEQSLAGMQETAARAQAAMPAEAVVKDSLTTRPQPTAPAPGELPTAYQAAEQRAQAEVQPVGALDSSPTLRTQAEIATQRQGLPLTRAVSAPVEAPTVAETPAGPLRTAAEVARQRAGVPEPEFRPRADLTKAPLVAETMETMRRRDAEARGRAAEAEPKPTMETPAYAGPERRTDTAARKRIEEMTPEEKDEAIQALWTELHTDELTGLGNKRGYQASEKLNWQASIDVIGLGWTNDNISHTAGDALLRAVGEALKASRLDAYHISGDEFVTQARSQAEMDAGMAKVEALLDQGAFSYTDAEGKKHSWRGMGISHAAARRNEEVGRPGDENRREAYADADDLLKEAKERLTAEGKRPLKGQRPPRMAEVGEGAGTADTGKRQDVSGDTAERKGVRRGRGSKAGEVAPAPAAETPAPAAETPAPAVKAVKVAAARSTARQRQQQRDAAILAEGAAKQAAAIEQKREGIQQARERVATAKVPLSRVLDAVTQRGGKIVGGLGNVDGATVVALEAKGTSAYLVRASDGGKVLGGISFPALDDTAHKGVAEALTTRPDVAMPAAKKAKVTADAAEAQARRAGKQMPESGRKGGEVSSQTPRKKQFKSLGDVEALLAARRAEGAADGRQLYVRWTSSPAGDAKSGFRSKNYQTGQSESGLSVNGLEVPEVFYGNVPFADAQREYLAMQISEYRFLPGDPYLVLGRKAGRGSDNEVTITDVEFVGKVSDQALQEAIDLDQRVAEMKRRVSDPKDKEADAWYRDRVRRRREEEAAEEATQARRGGKQVPERGRKGGEVSSKQFERPDWADELESVGGKIDDDGTVLLYHATTKEAAAQITKDGFLRRPADAPDDYGIYLSSSKAVASDYGDGTVVPVRVRAADLTLDDIFQGRRADFTTPTRGGKYRPVAVGDVAIRKAAPSAISVRTETDSGPRRIMSDTPGTIEGAPHKGRRPGDCG